MATKVRTRPGKPMKLAHKNCIKMWEIIVAMPTYRLKNNYTGEIDIEVGVIKRTAIEQFDDPDRIQSYCYLCEEYDNSEFYDECARCPIKTLRPNAAPRWTCGNHYDKFLQACYDMNEEKIRAAAILFLAELKEKLK